MSCVCTQELPDKKACKFFLFLEAMPCTDQGDCLLLWVPRRQDKTDGVLSQPVCGDTALGSHGRQRGHHPSGGSVCACSFLTTTSAFQGKLDTFYDFVQHCSQVPLMWCPPRDTLPPGLWVREPSPGICREERPRRGDLELMSLQTILNMAPVHFPCILVSRMSGPFFSRAMPSNSNLKRKGLERPMGLPSIVPPYCPPDPVGLLAAPHP
ncbi:hypothetical protein J1605_021287 [Eschrichtius robustus]|uniref:Uncharacterized protein n=1 Tax=Eschrichtius robustus TaxID=9764 RepID=A0AB34HEX9_ESCRO|nr:hypothetical protein J1605_021287 [Eschrichtius robustus]